MANNDGNAIPIVPIVPPPPAIQPPNPPVALKIDAAAASCRLSPKALLVAVVVVLPFTVVVVRVSSSAPTAPAMVSMLGEALE